jgi:predicted ATP-dependent endonuclease of OLD family
MIVEKLTINNYRNFRNFEVELQSFSLIIGENNVGKTNLLNALGLLFSSDISFIGKRNLQTEDINYYQIQEFKKQVADLSMAYENLNFPEVKIEVLLSSFNSDQEAVVGDWFTGEWDVDLSKNRAKITYLYNKREDLKKWLDGQRKALASLIQKEGESIRDFDIRKTNYVDFPIDYYGYSIYGGDDPTKVIDYRLLRFLKFEILDALRDAKTDLLASGNNTLLYRILHHRTENKLKGVKDQLLILKEVVKSNPELVILKGEIEKYLEEISLKGDDSKIDFDFVQMESSEMLKKLSMIYGSDPISIARNGLGRNNLLYISLVLSHLARIVDTKKRVFFKIVGVEEPEAHLHPHLQETLSNNIISEAKDSVQILATSHSTHITSKLPLDNTIVLFKENGEVKPYYLLKNIPKNSKVYLQKYLDATKSAMFFARRLILVEGISEQLVIPKFFELYKSMALERCGCNVINVNGVAFSHFLETVKAGYFIKCAAITDSDSNKVQNAAERAQSLKTTYDGDNIIVKITGTALSTFEKEIINANKEGAGKSILLEALTFTKPTNGKALSIEVGKSPLDIERFFGEIEVRTAEGKKTGDYKSEFAMNLVQVLNSKKEEAKEFNLPVYIKEAFDFILS